MSKRKIECNACSGTGLYHGFMEAAGEYVVCIHCQGRGWITTCYKEFKRRKGRKGVEKVRFGSGLIIDNPKEEDWMPYAEFKRLVPES